MKNTYHPDSPEWQLFERAESLEKEAIAFSNDADRYILKAKIARERADSYRVALAKLNNS